MQELRRAERVIGPTLRRLVPLLRVALLLVPVAWLGRRVDLAHVLARLGALPAPALAASFTWSCIALACFTERWRRLLRAWGATPPSPVAGLGLVLRSTFWNLLPGGLLGDLARSDAVRHSVGGLGNALAAFWFERLGGLAGLFVVALFAAHFAPAMPAHFTAATLACLAVSFLLLAVSLAATRSAFVARRLAALPVLGPRLGSLTPPSRPLDLALGLLLSLSTQSATSLALATVVHALAPAASLRTLVAVSPAAILLTFVPVTPGALGQRETAFSIVYAQAGVATDVAVAASLTSFALGLAFPLLGGVLAMLDRAPPRRPEEG